MEEQREFYDKLVLMEAALREQPTRESDPRWMSTPPDPFPASIFPFFHREPDPKHHPGQTRIQMLIAGIYMGQKLVVPEECQTSGVSEEDTLLEAAFDLSYDCAHWLECAAHFFHVRIIRDEHDILWTASKCLDLRRFAQMPGEDDDEGYEDIYDHLEDIWAWMVKAGVRDVPDVHVLYTEGILLAEAMQKDISDYYNGCADPTTTCHRWHFKASDGELYVRSGTTIQKDVWTMPHLSSKSPSFLWFYNHCLLKTANEAVVEGMCKVVGKQADKGRGLHFGRCVTCILLLFMPMHTYDF